MILLCGIPSEPPLAMVCDELEHLRVPHLMFSQRHFAGSDLSFTVDNGDVDGTIHIGAEAHSLRSLRGVYVRLMDDRFLPELRGEPLVSPLRRRCRALHDTLLQWIEVTPACVVNRSGAGASNSAKPYQAQLIRQNGFAVPETLITDDPDLVLTFRTRHKRVIYKSISGARSIVRELSDGDLDKLDHVRACPTQFQAFVPGTDIRVHTVGEAVFATSVVSDACDYRYASRQGYPDPELRAVQIRPDIAERCTALALALGLAVAGIDLRVTPEGEVFCLEVNPCPAFAYYEHATGQRIAREIARLLAAA